MNMGIVKRNYKSLAALLLVLVLAVQIVLPANAQYAVSSTSTHVNLIQADSRRVTADITTNQIKVHIYDKNATNSFNGYMSLLRDVGNATFDTASDYQPFVSYNCDLSINISGIEDGNYKLKVFLGEGEFFDSIGSISIVSLNGDNRFYSPNAGREQSFLSKISRTVNPESLRGYSEWTRSTDNYDEIAAKAKSLTANCTTDEQKVRAIHDWVCSNFAYDYEAYSGYGIVDAGMPSWAYNNKRGVCSGFARVVSLMMAAVDVPTINVTGYGDYDIKEGVDYWANHEWNLIYYNGSWHIFDFTWDCQNKYYGSGDSRNIYGKSPDYRYYDPSVFVFGINHMSMETTGEPVTDIIASVHEKQINVRDTFTFDVTIKPGTAGNVGLNYVISDPSVMTASYSYNGNGYTFSVRGLKEGTSTITVETYDGRCSDTCVVTVVKPTDDPKPDDSDPEDPDPEDPTDDPGELIISPTEKTVHIGDTFQITSVGTARPLYLKSSDSSVATIDNYGKVTAVGKGTAVISAVGENETATCVVTVIDSEDGVEMYRLYNPNSGEHFYTASAQERDYLDIIGWNYEGVGWVAPKSGEATHRLYNPHSGTHHYTMDYNEATTLASIGWNYEGVCWYSSTVRTTPLYRLYNPSSGEHHYTSSPIERDQLDINGWNYEGIAWYGV